MPSSNSDFNVVCCSRAKAFASSNKAGEISTVIFMAHITRCKNMTVWIGNGADGFMCHGQ